MQQNINAFFGEDEYIICDLAIQNGNHDHADFVDLLYVGHDSAKYEHEVELRHCEALVDNIESSVVNRFEMS